MAYPPVERIDLLRHSRLHWYHWLIVASSLLLTLGAWYVTKSQAEEKIAKRFAAESNRAIELVRERMEKYEDALWAGVATIHSQSHGIDYLEWKRFADTLHIERKYPGINGIGVIYRVPPEKLASYLEKERELRPDYAIHPPHEQNEYWPITYIEPQDSNAKAVGLDMAHEINRFTAAKKARDTGNAQITAPIILVQDAQQTPGFLFYVPFYKDRQHATLQDRQEHFIGLVYAPFIMKKLMRGTLRQEKRLVNIQIHDEEAVLFDDHQKNAPDYDANPMFSKTVTVEMYGRPWVFNIFSSASFRAVAHNNQPLMILIGGLLIDSLLLGLFIVLARSNKRTVILAEDMVLRGAQKFRLSFENSPIGMALVSPEGKWLQVNYALCDIIGYSEEELLQTDFQAITHPDDLNGDLNYIKQMLDKQRDTYQMEKRYIHKDGRIVWVSLSAALVWNDDGSPNYFISQIQDITDRKQAEAEHSQLVEKLTQSNTELERFAYVASHDMQEPLRMVVSFSEILKTDYASELSGDAQKCLTVVMNAGQRMQEMVADLLEYSRVNHDAQSFKEVDVTAELEHVLDNLSQIIKERQAEVTHDELPQFYGNPIQIMRLLQNLVANAIKYQPKDRTPKVHVGVEDQGTHWRFYVKDNGMGIEERFIDQIFKPFRRLHSWEQVTGTGLGLAICKKIVENHGGEIWVTSSPGEGSVFYFTVGKQHTNTIVAEAI